MTLNKHKIMEKQRTFFWIAFPKRMLHFRLFFTVISMLMLYIVSLIKNMLLNANSARVSIICDALLLLHNFSANSWFQKWMRSWAHYISFVLLTLSFSRFSSIKYMIYCCLRLDRTPVWREFSFISQTDNKYLEICTENTLKLVYSSYCHLGHVRNRVW